MGGFFPGKEYGGPPVSVDNFCTLMSDDECYIVTRDHDLSDTKRYSDICMGWNDRGNCHVLYLSDKDYNFNYFETVIKELNPDVLYLQGLFQSCIFPCLYLAKKYNVKVLLAPRGELCSGALSLKRYKKVPYIKILNLLGLTRNVHFQSTSNEETAAIKKWINPNSNRIHRMDNIPSIPKANYSRNEKVAGVGRFVFLSRIHPKKNLLKIIYILNSINGKVYFDIYGPIEDATYWNECLKAISDLPDNVFVEYKGLVKHEDVHRVFSQYDAFLFPTLSENYGHVIAESLAVGTPVIISDQTPWSSVNRIGIGGAFSNDDVRGYIDSINDIIDMPNDLYTPYNEIIKRYFYDYSNLKELKESYKNTFKAVII